jgi:uncharacterized protein (TIGR00730 family)
MVESICVFCGSNSGNSERYAAADTELGRLLAERGLRLVCGGGKVGLMGALADACLAGGGKVTGVMPQSLVDKEIAHGGLTELQVVGSMHARKARMADLAGAFIALPGGLGTFEEFFEVATWGQIGIQRLFALTDRAVRWTGWWFIHLLLSTSGRNVEARSWPRMNADRHG